MWFIALTLACILPLKLLMFFFVFIRFSHRARTSFLSALLLTNYSEFGLIVASLSVDQNWLTNEWLVIIALAISLSFICSTLLYKYAHHIYSANKDKAIKFQRPQSKSLPPLLQDSTVKVLIVGMGRVGTGAYHELVKSYDSKVLGVEVDQDRADKFLENELNVVCGDADDIEFWEQLKLENIKLIMLAIPSVNEMKNIIYQLNLCKYAGHIAAIARYDDEREELIQLGADVAFNYYAEVGTGFAEESMHLLESK